MRVEGGPFSGYSAELNGRQHFRIPYSKTGRLNICGPKARVSMFAVVRIVRGPTLADRIAALEVGLTALMCAVTVYAVDRDAHDLLFVLVIIAIVGFTASVAVSTAIEHESGDR